MAKQAKPVEQVDSVIVRFAGDSGDGMQLTGGRFTSETAMLGNDLSTFPDFPAEIRAPAGSLPGVSGFQVHFADHDILTPGDAPNVLVAMNPAALKTNLRDLPRGATLIVDQDTFTERNLTKAGYDANPLEDGSLDGYDVHTVPLTTMTLEATKEVEGVTKREAERAKNMFALGLMSWLYHRPTEHTVAFLERKFAKRPEIAETNKRAFQAGYAFGETTEDFAVSYEVKPAKLRPGTYRNITGNQALAFGLIAASIKSGLPLFLGAYPITPASSILEELARHKNFGVRTFQAEDEIAAVGASLGASFGGSLGVSTSAGPGVVLKSETVGLAVALELPLLIRPEFALYHLIRKYLDMGPAGLMLPWIERQEQMEALREAVFLPPKGKRGPGGPSTFVNRTLDRAGWDEVESALFLMPQFESPAGIKHLGSLVSHEWIDATMLGPYDLSVNLGRCGQIDHPEVVAAIERVRTESMKIDKPCGMVIHNVEQAKFWMGRGFTFFLCSEVSAMVRQQSRILVQGIRSLPADQIQT